MQIGTGFGLGSDCVCETNGYQILRRNTQMVQYSEISDDCGRLEQVLAH
jgi:hypothetical protein